MTSSGIFQQIGIYFRKTVRIAIHERFWKSLFFSAIVAFVIASVIGEKMFVTYENTQSGFFTIASACIWIGIFNSIQSVCREHEIIHADCRSGMHISSYVISSILWQFILCFLEAVVIFLMCAIKIDFPSEGLIFGGVADYFITVFLLLFCSACMGIMVSAIARDENMAMVIMPFVLIFQLIFAGTLFELSGGAEHLSDITFSKWGMSAFGSITNLNDRDLYPLRMTVQMMEDAANNPGAVVPVIELPPNETYENTASTLMTAWTASIGIAAICSVLSGVILKLRNRDS